jgi:hypothetical protein
MAKVLLQRTPQCGLIPANDESYEVIKRMKAGATVRCEISQMRNAKFFRKWWLLAKYAYDMWSETMPPQQYKGQDVQPSFERFRKDLTILAGHCHPVFNIRGEMRVEADSLRWDRMDEQEFEQLYSNTIQAVLTRVLHSSAMTEEQLRAHVDRVLAFD